LVLYINPNKIIILSDCNGVSSSKLSKWKNGFKQESHFHELTTLIKIVGLYISPLKVYIDLIGEIR